MLDTQQIAPVQVICDLRRFRGGTGSRDKLQALWQEASNALVGKPLVQGMSLEIELAQGTFIIWVVDSAGVALVETNTIFTIVDVLRNPNLLYRCQKCGAYGPLRCVKCIDEGCSEGQERLCSKHAHFIKDTLSAYCDKHKPRCECSANCPHEAVFFCSGCRSLQRRSRDKSTQYYGEHVHYSHPQNQDIDYCKRCYDRLFHHCSVCKKQGKVRLGKLRCAFKTCNAASSCGESRCWEHSFQWKIWGPESAGVILCEQHGQLLGKADPTALLFTMLSAKPPQRKQGYSLSNIYRLRHMINLHRETPLTFDQLGQALHALSDRAISWEPDAKGRYDRLLESFTVTMQELSQVKV